MLPRTIFNNFLYYAFIQNCAIIIRYIIFIILLLKIYIYMGIVLIEFLVYNNNIVCNNNK